ncbi:MAG: carboxypeptidase regulatory-like domain-containing protein [Verrucomicrobia bacterium]|nr:carboxypeptidase regulatory-like domain-containing protein [Verrucomicrobiota bacterium]
MALSRRSIGLFGFLSLTSAQAWGPHSEITQAALDTLGTNDALVLRLGAETQRLTNYCWMGDFHRLVFEEQAELFYADDYLLFPGATPQWEHFGPWLKQTIRPCFRRALQALRTENAPNAARWVGALTHFVEDTGAPPHALALRGGIHTALECWVETNAIHVAGYRPQRLGETDDKALDGLVARLGRIDELARKRGQSLRLYAELGIRSKVKPGVLECALETSRVTADLLHTLGRLAASPTPTGAVLRGTVVSTAAPGVERFPAKVVLEGTGFSTLAGLDGRYQFRGLPAGEFRVTALRNGGGSASAAVRLSADQTNDCNLSLAPKSMNLFRNADFKLRWASTNAPDCWYQVKGSWESEVAPLRMGQRYRLAAHFQNDAAGTVTVRWTRRYDHPLPMFRLMPRLETTTLTPKNNVLLCTGSADKGVMQVVVKNSTSPEATLQSVVLEPVPDETERR